MFFTNDQQKLYLKKAERLCNWKTITRLFESEIFATSYFRLWSKAFFRCLILPGNVQCSQNGFPACCREISLKEGSGGIQEKKNVLYDFLNRESSNCYHNYFQGIFHSRLHFDRKIYRCNVRKLIIAIRNKENIC